MSWICGTLASVSRSAPRLAGGVAILVLMVLPGCPHRESAAPARPGSPSQSSAEGRAADQPVRVKVVTPVREHLKHQSSPQPAHVGPYEETDIYAKVAGYLEAFGEVAGTDGRMRPVDIGDRVAKDQLLARLSVPELEQDRRQSAALVDQAKAEVGQAEASLIAAQALVDAAEAKVEETRSQLARYEAERAYRKSEYERYVALVRERAVRSELEDEKLNQLRAAEAAHQAGKAALVTEEANLKVAQAKHAQSQADLASARARLKVAQANLEHADIMLRYATITAPYHGLITRRLVDTGAFVQSAAAGNAVPLFTLARVDRLRIVAEIPESEAGLVRVGQSAAFQLNASRGGPLNGRVVRFADALDSETRTMRTEVELDGPANALRPGMFGSVTILLADFPDALLLPTTTLVPGGAEPTVVIVNQGRAHHQPIELGFNDGVRMHVLSGLTGPEQVIADGTVPVRDGQMVEVGQ